MSPLAAPLASLLFLSGFAVAQIFGPSCNSTWDWSGNSLGQDPCTVTAYMLSTCSGGTFTIDPLGPGMAYFGPTALEANNLCMCSTVGYSLTSACSGCQQGLWISWSQYSYNCSNPLPPSQFPNPVPSGTRVPGWALLDVTKEDGFDYNLAFQIGDTNEVGPGMTIGPSNSKHTGSSKVGAIVGGLVGGVAAISILGAGLFFYRRRRRSLAASTGGSAFGFHIEHIKRPMSGQESATSPLPETTTPLMRPYNPDDPSTFPEYQAPNPHYNSSLASPSPSRNLFTVASMPNSPSREYRGLPII